MELNFNDIWLSFLERMQKVFQPVSFHMWFDETKINEITDEKITLIVPMSLHKRMFMSTYYDLISDAFGGAAEFKEKFKSVAGDVFGSGWVWLTYDNDKFEIIATKNADTPIAHGKRPVLALDLWEHAYYLDYQNRRSDFVDAFLDSLIDWNFVVSNLDV